MESAKGAPFFTDSCRLSFWAANFSRYSAMSIGSAGEERYLYVAAAFEASGKMREGAGMPNVLGGYKD